MGWATAALVGLAVVWALGVEGRQTGEELTRCVGRCQSTYAEAVGLTPSSPSGGALGLRSRADVESFCSATVEAKACVGGCARRLPAVLREMLGKAFVAAELVCERRSEVLRSLPCLRASSGAVGEVCEPRCELRAKTSAAVRRLQVSGGAAPQAAFHALGRELCGALRCQIRCSEAQMRRVRLCRASPATRLLQDATKAGFRAVLGTLPGLQRFLPQECLELSI